MENHKKNKTDLATIRLKAEKLLNTDQQLSEIEMLRMLHELQAHQFKLEMHNNELITAKIQAEAAIQKYAELYNFAPSGYFTLSEEGDIIELNLNGAKMLGITQQDYKNNPFDHYVTNETKPIFKDFLYKIFRTNIRETCEVILAGKDNIPIYVYLTGNISQNRKQCLVNAFDISDNKQAGETLREREGQNIENGRFVAFLHDSTERKLTERYREMTREILQLLNEPGEILEVIGRVLSVLKTGTGFDAVGIRLEEGDDFPYVSHKGFSRDFLLTENTLIDHSRDGDICRDNYGKACLACTCGLVISGKNDPSDPFFTPGGSWWTNDSFQKLKIPPREDARFHPRNQCISHGYASLAIVPIRNKDRIVGLIQLNNFRKESFTRYIVQQLEGIASHIGAAILRIQAEETLRESEKRRLAILENAMDGFWLLDIQGRLLEVNETYCRMSGYSAQELRSMHIRDLEAINDEVDISSHLLKIAVHGDDRFESRHRRKDGSTFDIEVSIQYHAAEGGRFVTFLHDITGRKQVEENLRQSEERYKSLFQGNYSVMMIVDPANGEIKDANPAASQYYGWAHSELCGKNVSEINTLPKQEIIAEMQKAKEEKRNQFFFQHRLANGEVRDVELYSGPIKFSESLLLYSIVHDISERKQAERALHESEKSVRHKLQSILSPEGSITDLELNDIIDAPSIQKLMDSFWELAQIPMAIIDTNGNVLVGVGWQDICTKFHRVHPESCKNCIESDVHLTHGISEGAFRLYKCKNNLWDIATPINIGGEHKGNLFMGQFFFESEPIDNELFRKQAIQYGFEEKEYLDALAKVPRISKQKIEHAKSFFLNLSYSISQLSYGNIKLARAMTQQKVIENALKQSEELLNKAQEIAHLGSWSVDLITNRLTWSNEIYRIFGLQPHEFPANYEGFLAAVHPLDRNAVHSAYTTSVLENRDSYEIEHRVIRKHSGELRHVYEKCEHIRDASGKIVRSIGMIHDITERKQSAEAILENERLLRESQAAAHIGSYSADLINKSWKASPEIYEIFGIDQTYPNTLDGWIRRIHPDFREELAAELSNVKIGKNIFEQEYIIIRFNDGQERWVQGFGEFEYDDQSNPVRLIGTIQEITKRKKAEEALKKLNEELEDRVKERTAEILKSNIALQRTEEKYRTVADHTHDWEFWLNTDNSFIYCSPSCERITGYNATEFLKKPELLLEIIHPDDLKGFLHHKKEETQIKTGIHELQYRIVRNDGSIRWISHECQAIFDKSGNFIGIRGSNRDITGRKEIEQQLITSNQKYKLLSKNISDGIFIYKKGSFEYVNEAMALIFGYEVHELNRMKLTQLVKPEYFDDLEIFHPNKIQSSSIKNLECECLKSDRSTIIVDFFLNYVACDGVIYGVVHDITEKKQIQKNIVHAIIRTEENERAHFSKELHDGLGPLLSTIKLYLQWSERPKTNQSRQEIIHKAAEILEEALIAVKEISNKLSPHLLTNYGLTSAIKSFVDKVEETSTIKIAFESNVNRRLGNYIEAAMYRAVIECINNTLKHSQANNITIMIHDTVNRIKIQYGDNGIGFNLEETFSMHKGLGLFNLQNRIQTIGGKITLFSQPGKGVDYQIIVNI